jgi:hypothetical protein
MDQFTRRAVFVLYIILFLLSTTTVSMIQISINRSTAYTLNIEYEKHRCVMDTMPWEHTYTTILVNLQIMIDSYRMTLGSRDVGGFPLWIDSSELTEGETINISGNIYSLSIEHGCWKAHRSFDSIDYENLYY